MSRAISAILICMLLGCEAKKPATVRPEAEVERIFAELTDAFEKGDDTKAASYFAIPLIDSQISKDVHFAEKFLLEDTKKIGAEFRKLPPHAVKSRRCKVKGNFGVILFEYDSSGLLQSIDLRKTPRGWKFLPGFTVFSKNQFDFDFVVSDSDTEDLKEIQMWIAQQYARSEQPGAGQPASLPADKFHRKIKHQPPRRRMPHGSRWQTRLVLE